MKTDFKLRHYQKSNGYIAVELNNGSAKTFGVHRLVALAFLGNTPNLQVNHKNGVKQDNRVENLEWLSAGDNYCHAIKTGLAPLGDRNGSRTKPASRPRGESNTKAKLTNSAVIQMRSLRAQGETLQAIADRFSVCVQTAHNVTSRKNWGHVA